MCRASSQRQTGGYGSVRNVSSLFIFLLGYRAVFKQEASG
jgi:hypothetical protein